MLFRSSSSDGIKKLLEKAGKLLTKLETENKDKSTIDEVKDLIEGLKKVDDKKSDDKALTRISELIYDYDVDEEDE